MFKSTLWEKDEYGYYVSNLNGITFKVTEKVANNDKALDYAKHIAELYPDKKDAIENFLAEGIHHFLEDRYHLTKDEIKNKLNEPYIQIITERYGVVVWLNHDLDEHIYEVEFINDLEPVRTGADG